MSVATRLRLGPQDAGIVLSWEEFQAADYIPGYRYEVIQGRLEVSPQANFSHDRLTNYIDVRLVTYSQAHPEIINYVSQHAIAFVPGMAQLTCPEPDIAAYRGIPLDRYVEWEEISPLLTVEVLSPSKTEKDWVRNLDLYLRVSSIKEYWVVDGLTDENRPSMTVHRRWGQKWRVIAVPFDTIYTTRLLPGFELRMNPFAV